MPLQSWLCLSALTCTEILSLQEIIKLKKLLMMFLQNIVYVAHYISL